MSHHQLDQLQGPWSAYCSFQYVRNRCTNFCACS